MQNARSGCNIKIEKVRKYAPTPLVMSEEEISEEEETTILESWSVGVSKSKDTWSITVYLKGTRNDGSRSKCQFSITNVEMMLFGTNGLHGKKFIQTAGIPKGNWKPENITMTLTNNDELHVTMAEENLRGYTEIYRSNVTEFQTILELIEKNRNDIRLIAKKTQATEFN